MIARLSASWACGIALYAQASTAQLPRFEDYRVPDVYAGKITPPRMGDPAQYSGTDVRCFGEDRAQYGIERPNFGGHFVIDACPCGTGCHYLFMWDARTGKVYLDLPFGALNIGPYAANGNGTPIKYKGESYRPNSRLLIIDACREGTCDCAAKYYLWSGTTFRMLTKVVSRVPPNCQK